MKCRGTQCASEHVFVTKNFNNFRPVIEAHKNTICFTDYFLHLVRADDLIVPNLDGVAT